MCPAAACATGRVETDRGALRGQAPSIVFIDEIDAVGTKRYDSTSGGEREIQRTMLELLNQVPLSPLATVCRHSPCSPCVALCRGLLRLPRRGAIIRAAHVRCVARTDADVCLRAGVCLSARLDAFARCALFVAPQLDGFDSRGDVKVLLATNRIETLDPALLRPGRIDRKIEFPMPDFTTKRRIFQIHTGKMSLADDVDLDEFVMTKDDLSGADIKVRPPWPHCIMPALHWGRCPPGAVIAVPALPQQRDARAHTQTHTYANTPRKPHTRVVSRVLSVFSSFPPSLPRCLSRFALSLPLCPLWGPGDLHRKWSASAARAPHEDHASRLQKGQGEGDAQEEGGPSRGSLLIDGGGFFAWGLRALTHYCALLVVAAFRPVCFLYGLLLGGAVCGGGAVCASPA